MTEGVTITALVDNTVNVGGLRAEHGLCLLIRVGQRQLLFDTGQTDLLVDNARKMGLALDGLEAIVLSHGHYDHTGGLEAVCREAPAARVFAHPAALAPKFANRGGTGRFIGLAPASVRLLRQPGGRATWTAGPTEVIPGVFVTGTIPRANDFEDTGGQFYLDAGCTQPDPLSDDQALFFDTQNGLVVVFGCAHAGVINTLDHIRDLAPGRPLDTLIGGMHLHAAGPGRMQSTLEALRRWAPKRIIPAHCTGIGATVQLWQTFPGCCSTCPVGSSAAFEP